MQCPLICAAQQDRLAAGLYHCTYTYEHLLFILVTVQAYWVFGKNSMQHA
jgi:hypothetical protein